MQTVVWFSYSLNICLSCVDVYRKFVHMSFGNASIRQINSCILPCHSDADPSIPNLIPLFISVDPERDTVKAIADYVKGLTWTWLLEVVMSLEGRKFIGSDGVIRWRVLPRCGYASWLQTNCDVKKIHAFNLLTFLEYIFTISFLRTATRYYTLLIQSELEQNNLWSQVSCFFVPGHSAPEAYWGVCNLTRVHQSVQYNTYASEFCTTGNIIHSATDQLEDSACVCSRRTKNFYRGTSRPVIDHSVSVIRARDRSRIMTTPKIPISIQTKPTAKFRLGGVN